MNIDKTNLLSRLRTEPINSGLLLNIYGIHSFHKRARASTCVRDVENGRSERMGGEGGGRMRVGVGGVGGMEIGRVGGRTEGRMKELREMQFVGCKHACMTKKDAFNGFHISARINRKSPCIDGASVGAIRCPSVVRKMCFSFLFRKLGPQRDFFYIFSFIFYFLYLPCRHAILNFTGFWRTPRSDL